MSQPALQLSLQFADAALRQAMPRHKVARWIRAALLAPNTQWRGQDHATNVLTFDYTQEPEVMADLVLCAPVVVNESLELGVTLDAHCAHLLVHGTLHAQGFDHIIDADAAVMEARESALMLALGFADPYLNAPTKAQTKAQTKTRTKAPAKAKR
jgi:probable rRNA maturation factor